MFTDTFVLTEVDMVPDGKDSSRRVKDKKFDKVSRIEAHSASYTTEVVLDVNTEIYPMGPGDTFELMIASSLAEEGDTCPPAFVCLFAFEGHSPAVLPPPSTLRSPRPAPASSTPLTLPFPRGLPLPSATRVRVHGLPRHGGPDGLAERLAAVLVSAECRLWSLRHVTGPGA